jgi:acyl homoserine lactone synthase/acyl-homoserine lactone synthase
MFGTATTGTSHDIQAIPGLWRDAQGEAEALSSRGMHHAALRSAMLKDRKIVLMDRLGWAGICNRPMASTSWTNMMATSRST